MSKAVDKRIGALLDEAEERGSCLVPTEASDRRALLRRMTHGEIVSPVRGLFVRAETWEAMRRHGELRALFVLRGLASKHPEWVFCHASAALVHGLAVSLADISRSHVATTREVGATGSKSVVRHVVADGECELVSGLRVTSFWETVYDCLVVMRFPNALAVADSALRLRGLSRDEARDELRRRFAGRRLVSRVLNVLRWADGRSENGGESIARARMIELGFSEPDLQVAFEDPLRPGRWFRVDFVWRDASGGLVFGELEGDRKYRDEEFLEGRTPFQKKREEQERSDRLSHYRAVMLRFRFEELGSAERFAHKLEAKGVPRGPVPATERGVPIR